MHPSDDRSALKAILIVAEDAAIRQTLRQTLAPSIGRIDEAADIESARSHLNERSVHIIILKDDSTETLATPLVEWVKRRRLKSRIVMIVDREPTSGVPANLPIDEFLREPLVVDDIIDVIYHTFMLMENQGGILEDTRITRRGRWIASYDIKGVLGKGNMGIVYLAEKIINGVRNRYALKILKLPGDLNAQQKDELLERFYREAELVINLKHANIVRIVDFGCAQDEFIPYIAMDFICGRSLRHYINGYKNLNLYAKALLIRQVADALVAIHMRDICHRDIKPENIIIDRERLTAMVTDFGIARFPNSELTQTVKILGTPAYMAPEAFGSPKVDHRADIFSLGVVAYELFLGRKPFVAQSIGEYREAILNELPVNPRKLDIAFPLELERMLLGALKKSPDDRFNSANDVIREIDVFLECRSPSSRVEDRSDACDRTRDDPMPDDEKSLTEHIRESVQLDDWS